MDPKEMDAFLAALTQRITEKAAGSTPSTNFAHGPGGIFAQPGQRAQVVNAMVMPFGIADVIPSKRSSYALEVFPILTGQTAPSGTNPATACADCKQPGNLKVCNQVWPFGRWCMDSQVIQLDRLGLLTNRSEFVDQELIGDPFRMSESTVGAQSWDPKTAMRNEKGKQLFQLFVDWKRTFLPLVWTGNPTNNTGTPTNQGYAEPYGLQFIVNTGYQDAYTKQLCPAADPLIITFGANVATDTGATMRVIVEAYNNRKYLAEQVGLAPVRFALVMRYGLFRKLTEIWPCTYYTYQCLGIPSGQGTNFLNGDAAVKLRDEMRRGRFLLIDGEEVEVIIDSTLPETIGAVGGTATSDLYIIAMASPYFGHNPGNAIFYREFRDMNDPVRIAQEGIGGYPSNQFQVIGGGRLLVYPKTPSNLCIQYGMVSYERFIHEAPFLNVRITGLSYSFQYHEREYNPAAPYYFYDGGNYNFSAPYFYPPRDS